MSAGDLALGANGTDIVIGIRGRPVSSATPDISEALAWDGRQWAPTGVTTVTVPENYGAVGDGVADDTAAIQLALNQRGVIALRAATYRITTTLFIPSNTTLQGAGIGKTFLYMPAASFSNTTVGGYNTTSLALDCSGQLSAPFTAATNITLRDFTLQSEVSDGRFLVGIRASNVQNIDINGVEILGFPTGTAIALNSVTKRGVVRHCYVHDCTTALNTYGAQPQTTAVEVDNNRVNSVASVGLDIVDNRIEDLTFTGAALTAYGFQSDGVNLQNGTGALVHDNYIENVGEGIDTFASEGVITNNTLVDCYIAGIKLIHGASRNLVCGNTIIRPGLAGFFLAESTAVAVHTRDNLVSDNLVVDVDGKSGAFATPAAVRLESTVGATSNLLSNTFARNRVVSGTTTMAYALLQQIGTSTRFIDNEVEGFLTAYSIVSAGTATVINAEKTLVRAGLNAAQATAAGVAEVVEFETEEVDTQGEFNTTTHVFTATSPRRLHVCASVRYAAGGLGEVIELRIRKNGSTRSQANTVAAAAIGVNAAISDSFTVAIGDTVDIEIYQNNGARNIGGGVTTSWLEIVEIAS